MPDNTKPEDAVEVLPGYSEQALAERQIDFLEKRAIAWMADTSVQNMFNALASVFENYASQGIMDRFRKKMNTIGIQCHIEGALRVWEEIAEQQRRLGIPLPTDAADAVSRLATSPTPAPIAITMQDVRLVAGEGKLSPQTVLDAVNVVLRQRAGAPVAMQDALSDPNAVHINMLRGEIAKPTIEQIVHIYGADALRAAISPPVAMQEGEVERVARAITNLEAECGYREANAWEFDEQVTADIRIVLAALRASSPVGEGWKLVPDRATEQWYHVYANWRQGQRSTPSCEPPGGRDLAICRDLINEVLAAAPVPPAGQDNA